jgi:hypothetical protein
LYPDPSVRGTDPNPGSGSAPKCHETLLKRFQKRFLELKSKKMASEWKQSPEILQDRVKLHVILSVTQGPWLMGKKGNFPQWNSLKTSKAG